MVNALVPVKKEGYKNEIVESSEKNCLSDRLSVEVKPEDVLLSGIDKPQISHFCIQKLCLRRICGLNNKIPKQITSLEETFLRYCLELIHTSASRDNLWTIPSKVNFLPKSFSSAVSSRIGCDALFLVSSGVEIADISSSWDPIIGSITRSTGMMNSPLMCQLGALDDDVCHEKTCTIEVREPMSSAHGLHVGSSQERQNERIVPEDQKFGSEPLHKRLLSLPASSSSNAYYQGTLHCSWNDGFPYYVFSIEDKRKVLITTNLLKVESLVDKGVDYIYTFRSRAKESDLGEMRVSTSFEFCPHGTEIMETRFVLCANGDAYTLDQMRGKNEGLSKKMANIFRGHFCKQTMQENLLEPNQEGIHLSPPKLELAAIVLKHHIPYSQKEVEIGGWGLKFLRKDRDSESCRQNTSHCSTSMNVLVPADFHGGPRTRNGGGPSSLVERWRSGGSCDCGGWDLGCPLTVLHGRPNHQDGVFGETISFDLFTQGCKQSVPVLKMVNVRDGLYDLHYKPTLSALQSLSIAVAAIHGHSPILRHTLYAK